MIKFGTGGWRAIIGDEFTKSNIQLLVQGLCDNIRASSKQDKPVIIGYDRRFLSEEGAKWAAEVFCGNSVKVHFRLSIMSLIEAAGCSSSLTS